MRKIKFNEIGKNLRNGFLSVSLAALISTNQITPITQSNPKINPDRELTQGVYDLVLDLGKADPKFNFSTYSEIGSTIVSISNEFFVVSVYKDLKDKKLEISTMTKNPQRGTNYYFSVQCGLESVTESVFDRQKIARGYIDTAPTLNQLKITDKTRTDFRSLLEKLARELEEQKKIADELDRNKYFENQR
jgi:hypothetical protein